MGMAKFAEFASSDEKKFGLLRVERIGYPNSTFMFIIRPNTNDPREQLSLTTSPGELAMELRKVADWLETPPPAA